MLLTTGIKKKSYMVYFSHFNTQCSNKYVATECRILNMHKDGIAIGGAVLKPGDIFRKDIGRKKALTSALRAGKFTRSQRTAMWKSYFAQCPLRRSK